MPSFSVKYVAPGAYVKFLRENLSPNLTAGYRVPVYIGSGVTNKTSKITLTRGSGTQDALPVPAVQSIVQIGNSDFTTDYKLGVDYSLSSNNVVWETPGTVVAGSFNVNDLEFGSLSTGLTVTKVSQLVNDGYVVEVTSSGVGSTKGRYNGGSAIANNISVSETITVTIGTNVYSVGLVNGDSRATVLSKFQSSLDGVATVSLGTGVDLDKLFIVTEDQGSSQTISVSVTNSTLKVELGLSNGSSDIFVSTPGTTGVGQVSITARSDRSTVLRPAGEVVITDIPGIELTVLNTTSYVIGEKAEILTNADLIAKNPLEGSTYFVTLVSQKQVSDYELQYFTREEEDLVYQIYGDPSPTNSVSLAAYIAFRNLAEIIGIQQVQGTESLATFQQAIDKLIDKPIYYVVPLSTDPLVHAYTKFHVNQQSSTIERRERMAYLGGSANYSIFDHQDSVNSLKDERIVWVAPSSWNIEYVDTNNVTQSVNVDGTYGAVAVSAIASVRDPSTPLTRKQIVGLKPLVTYDKVKQNLLAESGCLVVETFGAVSRVRHQLTTYGNGPIESKEISLVQLRDHVSIILRQNLEDEFPGQKILRATPQIIKSYSERIFEGLVAQEIINGFSNLTARQNDIDPTQVDITVSIDPIYPLNYLLVTFKFLRQAQVNSL